MATVPADGVADMSIQLDLFEIAEMNARAEMASCNPEPEELRIGDIVHVNWNNGVEFDGICTGCRGFWDGRQEFERWHWVLRYNVKHRNGSKRDEEHRDYSHFDPYKDEWTYVGHDDEFRVPDINTATERLIECIKDVPFPKRLVAFQAFTNEHPHLSLDWSPVMSDAWATAITATTTIDELLREEKTWTCKLDLPMAAVRYIEDVVFHAKPDCRLDLIRRMRWLDSMYSDKFYVHYPEQRDITYYCSLYRKFIREATTPKELVSVIRMRGGQSKWVDEKPPTTFWIEEVN